MDFPGKAISERLQKELPGLKGFSARNLRNMRMFYEEWNALDSAPDSSKEQLLADASASLLTFTLRIIVKFAKNYIAYCLG